MAQQTSALQRKQTTPRPIGRLMAADVSGPFFPLYRNPLNLGIPGGTEPVLPP
jgi:hypothetical protein